MPDQATALAAIDAWRAAVVALFQATPPPPPTTGVLSTLAPNTARNLGTYVNPDPDWSFKGKHITDDSGCAMDVARNQFLLMGGGHGISQETDIRAFNTVTGQWSSLYPSTKWSEMLAANRDAVKGSWINTNQPCARHTYGMMVVRGDRLYCMTAKCQTDNVPEGVLPTVTGKICWYDLAGAGGWTYSQHSQQWQMPGAAVVDPVSNEIYVFSQAQDYFGTIFKYSPDTDSAPIKGPRYGFNVQPVDAVYSPICDKFYVFGAGGVVSRVTINRTNFAASSAAVLTTTGTKPPVQTAEGTPTGRPYNYPSFSWDSVNNRIGGCFVNGIHYQFDPVTSVWSATTMQVEAGSSGAPSNDFSCSAFDASTGCYICVQIAPSPRTWAYRP